MTEYSRLDPHVIGEITAICKAMLDELDIAREIAQDLRRTEGFGDLESAKQLAAGYARKASGSPTSAVERIDQFIENLTALRDAFSSGGHAFIDANSDWGQRLRAMEEQSYPQPTALSTGSVSGQFPER